MSLVLALLLGAPPLELDLALLEDRFGEAPFVVRVLGPGRVGPLARKACAHLEWAIGERKDGRWLSLAEPSALGVDLELEIDDAGPPATIRVVPSQVRFHLAPVATTTRFDRAHLPGGLEAPRPSTPLTLAEYCLEVDGLYHARIESVHFVVPIGPWAGREVAIRTLVVSDVPFVAGDTSTDETPYSILRPAPNGLPLPPPQ